MKIKLTSVSIDDYDKALKFYTEVMGFVKKQDIPLGEGARWITASHPKNQTGRNYSWSRTQIILQ
jgi:catechol 2,3-dioxygenase-like lactoylglutathione lyase family enzyme